MNFFTNIFENIYFFILDIIDFIKRNILLLLLIFITLAGTFIVIREFFYFGTLTIHVNQAHTKIIINGDIHNLENENFTLCEKNKCTLKLFPNTHSIIVQKNGFSTESQQVDIKFKTNTEIFFQLQPNITQITQTIFTKSSGIVFPQKESIVSKNVSNFSIKQKNISQTKKRKQKEYVFFKNTPLFSVVNENPVFVSTDEIGRNVFIVSAEKIIEFNTQTKTTQPSLIPNNLNIISAFFPQNNGDYLYQYKNDENIRLHKTSEKKEIIIKNSSLHTKIHATCITPAYKIVFLAHNPLLKHTAGLSVYTAQNLSFAQNTEKTVLSNLYIANISHIECINENKITVFLKDKTAYSVEF